MARGQPKHHQPTVFWWVNQGKYPEGEQTRTDHFAKPRNKKKKRERRMDFVKGRFACGIATGTLLALVGLRIQALLATKNAKAPVVVDAGAPASGVVGAGAGAGAPAADAGEQCHNF